jgi:hypothetical protein
VAADTGAAEAFTVVAVAGMVVVVAGTVVAGTVVDGVVLVSASA